MWLLIVEYVLLGTTCVLLSKINIQRALLAKGLSSGLILYSDIRNLKLSSSGSISDYLSTCSIITYFIFYKSPWNRININNLWMWFLFWLSVIKIIPRNLQKKNLCLNTYSLAIGGKSLLDSELLRQLTWGGILKVPFHRVYVPHPSLAWVVTSGNS